MVRRPGLVADISLGEAPAVRVGLRSWGAHEVSGRAKRLRAPVTMALLIHGYKVRQHDAERDFDRLRALIEIKSPKASARTLHVTWPGFELYYPSAVATAPLAGQALGEYLVQLHAKGARHVILVAHSLGCRVVLEGLERYRHLSHPADLRLTIILMAAAVPVDMVSYGGSLRTAALVPDERRVLYSTDDAILTTLFKLGQSAALEGVLPEAVGTNGRPGNPPWTSGRHMRGFNHGDYWSCNKTAYDIAARLDSMNRRELPNDSLPKRDTRRRRLAKERLRRSKLASRALT